eukprot:sb/3478911/
MTFLRDSITSNLQHGGASGGAADDVLSEQEAEIDRCFGLRDLIAKCGQKRKRAAKKSAIELSGAEEDIRIQEEQGLGVLTLPPVHSGNGIPPPHLVR